MSVWRRALTYLGLVDDEEYDEAYAEGYEEYEPETVPAGPTSGRREEPASGPVNVVRPVESKSGPVRVVNPAVRPVPAAKVHVMEPAGFNEAQEVGDRLKGSQPVILNLQGVDRDLQRRLIDFSSGLAYALGGTMAKVADQVFLLTPSNVEVSDEEKERLQARGLYRPR